MNQARTRLTLITGLCVIGASALVLYSCGGSSGGGGNNNNQGGGGGGTTTISNASEASQAAVTAAASVINAVSTVGGLGFTFTKPMLAAKGKTIPFRSRSKDVHVRTAAAIRTKMMEGKGMQQKMALLKSRRKAGTAQTQVSDTFWEACDNYNGNDGTGGLGTPNGTDGFYTVTDMYDNLNFVPETYTSTDMNCQYYNDGISPDSGGIRYDGTIEFGETNYTEGPGADEFSSDYFSREHGKNNNNTPYVFEYYQNTTSATNVTDLTALTRTLFFESTYDLSGTYAGTTTYDDSTGAATGDTDFTLALAGDEHFGTDILDFTFNYDDLTEEGSFSWDDGGFTGPNSDNYSDHTAATVNGGFGFDFSADLPTAKPASVSPLDSVSASMSVSFTDAQYNDDYSEDNSGYDDRYDVDGLVDVTYDPADVCFEGTFDISTPKRIHETESAFCPIDGKFAINGNTTVTFNNDESVDVSVGGNNTHYDDCIELDSACVAGVGLTGNL